MCLMFHLYYLIGSLFLFVFFFSSRRRHTRLVSDWSSDVCSSDLACTALITRDALPISGSSVDVVPPGGVTVYSGWKRTSASTPTMLPSRYPIRTPPPILWASPKVAS